MKDILMVIRILICRKHGRIVENGRYGRVIYALITNLETVRENYGNSECNN